MRHAGTERSRKVNHHENAGRTARSLRRHGFGGRARSAQIFARSEEDLWNSPRGTRTVRRFDSGGAPLAFRAYLWFEHAGDRLAVESAAGTARSGKRSPHFLKRMLARNAQKDGAGPGAAAQPARAFSGRAFRRRG